MDRPLIFITNDDGVSARGIAKLTEVASSFGDVVVIAPEQSQSGKAHAITMFTPLYLRSVSKDCGKEIYACSGTPVDCVKMGFDHLLFGRRVDLVLSGINHGSNSAISVLYSGTMGAAIEGSFYGAPSIGFSLLDHSADADFEASGIYAESIIRKVLDARPALPLCLNVNIPVGRPEQIRGVRVCRQARGFWKEEFYCRKDPRGKDYFWLTGDFYNEEPAAEDTDERALKNGYVSVVPVHVDLTDYSRIGDVSDILK